MALAIEGKIRDFRLKYADLLETGMLGPCCGLTTDGRTLNFQGKHFYDLSSNFFVVQREMPTKPQVFFTVKKHILLLAEGPEKAIAANIREILSKALQA